MQFIKSLDRFGQPLQIEYQHKNDKYKSVQGGILTILLYSTALAFGIYKFQLWAKGEINPTTSQVQAVLSSLNVELDYELMEISFEIFNNIDPFNTSSLILEPVLVKLDENGTQSYPESLLLNMKSRQQENWSSRLVTQNISFSSQKDQHESYLISLMLCSSNLFERNCASQDEINQFFKQPNLKLELNVKLKQFDPATNQVTVINKRMEYAIDNQITSLYSVWNMKVQQNIIDDGILFAKVQQVDLVYDFYSIVQQMDTSYFRDLNNNINITAMIHLKLDPICTVQYVSYMKISEVLAEIGSICATLFTIQFIAILFNERFLRQELIDQVIGIYFPTFNKLRITKDLFGNVKFVEQNGVQVKLSKFKSFYDDMAVVAEDKLSFRTLLYEMSRMQFIIQSLQKREIINQVHKVGIPINFANEMALNAIRPTSDFELMVENENAMQLCKQDFYLLTKFNDNYESKTTEFYDINRQTKEIS